MKHSLLAAAAAALLAACSGASEAPPKTDTPAVTKTGAPVVETSGEYVGIQNAMNGVWRTAEEKARDEWRHPAETLEFFGVKDGDTVVEIWPGGGWYTNILAPHLASTGGTFIAAQWDPAAFEDAERRAGIEKRIADFKARYDADTDTFGNIQITGFSKISDGLAPEGTADVVLTFRNVHNWMGNGYELKAFQDAFAALKPGGVLGVVEHRLPSSEVQDPKATTGYVHEDYVKALAAEAGFEFAGASEINANPADTADHPFGVWTLPPVSATKDRDGNTPEDFDAGTYKAIGESDRMTLKFVKPAAE